MAAVFLSYSSQDRERVALLAESLRVEGFEVWWDREIPVAVTYEDYIRRQLDSAGAVVVVWSQSSVASRYVRWEAQRAERRRGVLVPVMIEEADLPPEYFLVQSADLSRWTGDRSDREWRRLVAALVRLVGEPVRPEVAEEKPAAAPLPAEVPAEVAPASDLMVPEAAPVVEEAAALEEAAAPPAAITAEPSAVELEPIPEEAIPIPDLAEAEAVEAEFAPAEELGEGAVLAEAEVAESLRAWEPVAEEAPLVPEAEEQPAAGVPVAGPQPRRGVPWYRRWWALAGVGALVLAAVVVPIVVVLSGGGEEATTTLAASTTEAVSTSQGATTTEVTPTTAMTPTTVPVADLAWARVPLDQVGEACFGCAALGDLLVEVGHDPNGTDAGVWTRAEGQDWERVPHDEAVFGGPGKQVMNAVAAGGPGLVAVGYAEEADGELGGAAVWTSANGLIWERVPHDEVVFGGPGMREMTGVAAGGPGLVAVGIERPTGGESGEADGAVWTSADGRNWLRVPDDAGVFSGPGNQEPYAVAVGGVGLVAVGYDDAVSSVASDQGWDAAVWVSVDGVNWERVTGNDSVIGGVSKQVMYGLVAGGPGLVAVGADESGGDFDGAVWASIDGLTWARVPHDEAVFGGSGHQFIVDVVVLSDGAGLAAWGKDENAGAELAFVSPPLPGLEWARVAEGAEDFGSGFSESRGVAAGGSGLVAVGAVGQSGTVLTSIDAAVWTSVDGVAWHRVTGQQGVLGGVGAQGMIDVVAGGPGYVAIGFDNPGDEPWSGDAAVWTSRDGTAWERVTDEAGAFGGSGDRQMRAVAVGGPGLVAVGWELTADGQNAAVWTSVDGLAWARVDDQESLRRGAMLAVTAGGPGLVAVGEAAVWTSVDGLTWERVGGHEAVFGNSKLQTVTTGGPGLVAVGFNWPEGTEEWGDVAVWVSADGTTWERVPHDEAVFSVPYDSLEDCEVVSTGRRLIAAAWGIDHDAGAETAYGALVWYSTDGVTWSRVSDDAGIFGGPEEWSGVAGLVVADEGAVAVGQLEKSVAVWVSPPPE